MIQTSKCGSFGWEQITDASLTFLLSNQLAKTPQEKSVLLSPLAQLCDVEKFKKHIAIVLERLSNGAVLSASGG